MYEVLVVTHGRLGEEMLSTARMVFGDPGEGVAALGLMPGEAPDALLDAIRTRVSGASGGCLVLCDILGGSPFLMAARAYQELRATSHVIVLSGLNLGMLLEALSSRAQSSLEEGAQAALDAALQSVRNLSEQVG